MWLNQALSSSRRVLSRRIAHALATGRWHIPAQGRRQRHLSITYLNNHSQFGAIQKRWPPQEKSWWRAHISATSFCCKDLAGDVRDASPWAMRHPLILLAPGDVTGKASTWLQSPHKSAIKGQKGWDGLRGFGDGKIHVPTSVTSHWKTSPPQTADAWWIYWHFTLEMILFSKTSEWSGSHHLNGNLKK